MGRFPTSVSTSASQAELCFAAALNVMSVGPPNGLTGRIFAHPATVGSPSRPSKALTCALTSVSGWRSPAMVALVGPARSSPAWPYSPDILQTTPSHGRAATIGSERSKHPVNAAGFTGSPTTTPARHKASDGSRPASRAFSSLTKRRARSPSGSSRTGLRRPRRARSGGRPARLRPPDPAGRGTPHRPGASSCNAAVRR